jgi:gliding motility-associated-like protein
MNRVIRTIFILLFSALFCFSARAQTGTWVWMKGAATVNPAANFGIQGVSAPTNTPSGLYEPYEFQDGAGNFWIFGGRVSISFQMFADLWRFNPTTNEWTWIKGPGLPNAMPNYGVQGVSAPTNNPGARYRGFSWVDNSGNFWIMGGYGYDVNGTQGALNDLWKYDLTTNEWTWMKGSNVVGNAGSYGTILIPSMANNPPAREACSAAWTAANGDLWCYGGEGIPGTFGDMWKYSPATNMWTWMSGLNTTNNPANHGTLNVPNAGNYPGSRAVFSRWKDSNGRFWMYGGIWSGSTYSDIWMFDPATNIWTWKGGTVQLNDPGNYGQNCLAGGFFPCGRTESRATWQDACGRLFMMGGNKNSLLNQALNDIWFFDPALNEFAIVGGSNAINQPGNFGSFQVPAPSNYPPSTTGSVGFKDAQGNFWLFGGLLNPAGDVTNAFWKYTPPNPCPDLNYQITTSIGSACAPSTTQFQITPNTTQVNYVWDFGDPAATNDTASGAAPSYTYANPGTYYITIIATSNMPCNVFTDTIIDTLVVNPIPNPNLGSDTIICGAVNEVLDPQIIGNSYLWSTGDTTQSIAITASGTYIVGVTQNGCTGFDTVVVTNFLPPDLGNDTNLCEGLNVYFNAGFFDSYQWNTGAQTAGITVSSSGTYVVAVSIASCQFTDTVIVNFYPIPAVDLGNDTSLCPGDTLFLDAGNPGSTYAWSNGSTASQQVVTTSGYYNVIVTANDCSGVGDVDVTFFPDIELGPAIPFCNTESIMLVGGPIGYNYLWSTGETSNTIQVASAGDYSVEVNDGVCVLSDTIQVTGAPGLGLLFVPNAFTPNGKGNNEIFRAYGDGITFFEMQIFNRWGELIWEGDDLTDGWDGTTGSMKAPEGVYVVRVLYRTECQGEQDIERFGHLILIR